MRPAEPCSISVAATHQTLTQLLLHIMYYLRHFDVRGRATINPPECHVHLGVCCCCRRCHIIGQTSRDVNTFLMPPPARHQLESSRHVTSHASPWLSRRVPSPPPRNACTQEDGLYTNTCGSTYVREEVRELAQLNEMNLHAIRDIIGHPAEASRAAGASEHETTTSASLRAQGRRWAQHVLEGPISWAMSAGYIAATVIAGATPLSAILDAAVTATAAGSMLPDGHAQPPGAAELAAANAALLGAVAALTDNATLVESARVLTEAAMALEVGGGSIPAGGADGPFASSWWLAAGYVVAVLDACIYIFLPWWTTVLLRLIQGRPWLHRVASRSVLVSAALSRCLEPMP